MSDAKKGETEADGERRARTGKMGDGIKQGIGVLAAFRDALEETIQEARERGDLSGERAKEVMKDALGRAQTAAEGARHRLDFVNQADMDGLNAAVDSMRTRLSELEKSVFGESKDRAASATGDDEAGKDAEEAGQDA